MRILSGKVHDRALISVGRKHPFVLGPVLVLTGLYLTDNTGWSPHSLLSRRIREVVCAVGPGCVYVYAERHTHMPLDNNILARVKDTGQLH